MNRQQWIGCLGIAFVLASPFAVHALHRSSALPVDTGYGQVRVVRDSVLASGSLIYDEEALLSPEVIGRVVQVLVKEGEHVDKGQVVVRIDDQTYRDAVAQQEATVRAQEQSLRGSGLDRLNKNAQLDRMKALMPKGYVSKTDFDTTYYAYQAADVATAANTQNLAQAKALLRQQFELLEKTVIRAPMAGTVVAVSIKTGETAVPSAIGIPGSSLVTIANTRSIMIDLNVDESDIAHLKVGQSVEMHCPPLPDKALGGTIRSIALGPRRAALGSTDAAAGRSYSVKADLNDTQPEALRPGMDCRAEIFTSSPPPSLSIPVQAVINPHTDDTVGLSEGRASPVAEGSSYVFVVQEGYARRRLVHLGASNDAYQEIRSGLSAGEKVILGPYRNLRALADGDRVIESAAMGRSL